MGRPARPGELGARRGARWKRAQEEASALLGTHSERSVTHSEDRASSSWGLGEAGGRAGVTTASSRGSLGTRGAPPGVGEAAPGRGSVGGGARAAFVSVAWSCCCSHGDRSPTGGPRASTRPGLTAVRPARAWPQVAVHAVVNDPRQEDTGLLGTGLLGAPV